jgi:hypothetical protein
MRSRRDCTTHQYRSDLQSHFKRILPERDYHPTILDVAYGPWRCLVAYRHYQMCRKLFRHVLARESAGCGLRGAGRKRKWRNALGLTGPISATLNAARKTFACPRWMCGRRDLRSVLPGCSPAFDSPPLLGFEYISRMTDADYSDYVTTNFCLFGLDHTLSRQTADEFRTG